MSRLRLSQMGLLLFFVLPMCVCTHTHPPCPVSWEGQLLPYQLGALA